LTTLKQKQAKRLKISKSKQKEKLLKTDLKASELVRWLKDRFDLGHGHSMAIWAVFKSEGWVGAPKDKKPQ
jgi:hypothetical protein